MDIHKPKPWHGWREFLKEYLIIVVGVLTALGAEQGVEWLHWRHLAQHGEADLAAGIQPDLANAYSFVVTEACGRSRAAELVEALQKPRSDWRGDPLPMSEGARAAHVLPQVYPFGGGPWPQEAWDTAVASGVLNHMPSDRVAVYANLYHIAAAFRAAQSPTNITASHLTPLAYDRKLTEGDKAHYLELVAELASQTETFGRVSRIMLQQSHALGVDLPASRVSAILNRERTTLGSCVTDVTLPLT